MDTLKQLYYWFEHFFWLIRMIIKNLFKGNYNNVVDLSFWMKIHLTHKGRRMKNDD